MNQAYNPLANTGAAGLSQLLLIPPTYPIGSTWPPPSVPGVSQEITQTTKLVLDLTFLPDTIKFVKNGAMVEMTKDELVKRLGLEW